MKNKGLANPVKHPVIQALLISLLLHFILIAGVEFGRSLGLWKTSALPTWIKEELARQQTEKKSEQNLKAPAPPEDKSEEPPLLFVDVDASKAEEKPPEESKYYAVVNTKAANKEPKINSKDANLTGDQERVPKAVDSSKSAAEPLQPAPKPKPKPEPKSTPEEPRQPPETQPQARPEPKTEPPPKQEPAEREEPKPPLKEGETLVARAIPQPQPRETIAPVEQTPPRQPPSEEAKPRARTLQEARQQKGLIDGSRMRQQGGVGRIVAEESVNARETPFSSYDAALIAAVQARWDNLLEDRRLVRNQAGRVVLEFRLHQDGRITNMNVAESNVSDTLSWLCQRAIMDPSPYAPFPSDLRRLLRTEYREVRFTFYYDN
jgi:outer membrane biosynthesis protein TonB